jgi:hypothetical protein
MNRIYMNPAFYWCGLIVLVIGITIVVDLGAEASIVGGLITGFVWACVFTYDPY